MFREWLFNNLIMWMAAHCRIWASSFYAVCEKMQYHDLKVCAESALAYKRAKGEN